MVKADVVDSEQAASPSIKGVICITFPAESKHRGTPGVSETEQRHVVEKNVIWAISVCYRSSDALICR